ncbi:recombinase family protein [Roseomonas sp. GC11]|uniref:recombinase family protein n=1 Tax=Roseomonas sp. GC11 TaxID=2950546 RepID=UPI002109B62E|nr:recombinase family protein [Roseomonas sp. GC11]MCQ4159223.1 recombinase family protein [Roseomonas sp. GC11]
MTRKSSREADLPATTLKRRCAVYTRKSTEEGLEKEFNSLDAQRDACEAYIASQRGEGWLLVADRYDDGGISGSTLERPALQRLLREIEAGYVDVVVVYKIDRLSRSLMHFAKLVEVFDAHSVTFVSVTQSFNTTTSMGRLTLNILLSFAQFEREVIRERVQDKVAASKARGLWMGGPVPLGYVVRDRKLVIEPSEAAVVQRIFSLFAETRSGFATLRQLAAEGVRSKSGRPFDKGSLYRLLHNRISIGEVTHKGQAYPGAHPAILPRALWDEVQAIINTPAASRANQNRRQSPALLRGLIFGPDGRAMSPSQTRRRGKLYRYYVAQAVMKGARSDCPVRRLPAGEIEGAVVAQLRALLRQPEVVVGTWRAARAEAPEFTEGETLAALERLDPLWEELFPAEQARIVRLLVERVDVSPAGADIRLRLEGLASLVQDLRRAA